MAQEHGLTFRLADPRMVEVDVDHRLADVFTALVRLPKTDQERPALLHRGDIPGVPAVPFEKQVFVLVEAEQRNGLQFAIGILAKQDRIFALHVDEFGGEDQDAVDAVAELG